MSFRTKTLASCKSMAQTHFFVLDGVYVVHIYIVPKLNVLYNVHIVCKKVINTHTNPKAVLSSQTRQRTQLANALADQLMCTLLFNSSCQPTVQCMVVCCLSSYSMSSTATLQLLLRQAENMDRASAHARSRVFVLLRRVLFVSLGYVTLSSDHIFQA